MSISRNFMILIAMASIAALGTITGEAQSGRRWIATWATSPVQVSPLNEKPFKDVLENTTVRQVVPLSIGGSGVRLRLTNVMGTGPARLEDVTISIQSKASGKSTSRPVMFGGQSAILIPAESQVISDPVTISVGPLEDASVSFYIASIGGLPTLGSSGATSFVAPGKIASPAADDKRFNKLGGAVFLAGVDVIPANGVRGTVVTLGDTFSAGGRTTWSGVLASRLAEGPANRTMGVVNHGVSGNRLLSNSPCWGPNGLARAATALQEPGIYALIVAVGGSDVRMMKLPGAKEPAEEYPESAACYGKSLDLDAKGIIGGYQQIAALARARGVKVFATPITPYKDHGLWSPVKQKIIDEVNTWMRTGGAFDGFIDMAAACADPSDPLKLAKTCDSGDRLHLSQNGAAIMGRAINLSLLTAD